MNNLLAFSFTVFMGLFAIMNPFANIPIFLGLVDGYSKDEKKAIARKSTIIAFIILVSFIVLGKYIFSVFGITIPAFKITGGLLLFYIGFEMLQSKPSKVKNNNANDSTADESIAASPIAIPILAGPGAIVTAMNYVSDTSFLHMGIVIAMAFAIVGLNYLAFRSSEFIVAKLGNNVIMVIDKIMGLILAIIGTGMVISGVKLIA